MLTVTASRYLRRSETPYEVSKCYRSRSPLTRSDQEVSPVSACKISGDEKRGCTVARKRKSDQQDSEHLRKRPTLSESQGPLKKPSHPPQLIAFSTPLPNMLSALGSAGTNLQKQGLKVLVDFIPRCSSRPSSTFSGQQAHEENRKARAVSQKRKVEERQDSECPCKMLRKEDPPSPSITPDVHAIEETPRFSERKRRCAEVTKFAEEDSATKQECMG
ncbi:uncharacterized protein LOC130556663 [Triplophysa rosa]|uniref:uncharacterized protein LOC130556663 n=1 Tax=Triplophysa rosa TaxID=992332 RepID=UPI0025462402|nr:uncharacterized protein LOC130556663 [Triplophysa rosa]